MVSEKQKPQKDDEARVVEGLVGTGLPRQDLENALRDSGLTGDQVEATLLRRKQDSVGGSVTASVVEDPVSDSSGGDSFSERSGESDSSSYPVMSDGENNLVRETEQEIAARYASVRTADPDFSGYSHPGDGSLPYAQRVGGSMLRHPSGTLPPSDLDAAVIQALELVRRQRNTGYPEEPTGHQGKVFDQTADEEHAYS